MRTPPHNPWLIVCALAALLGGALPAFAQAPATQPPPPPPPRPGSGPHEGFGIQVAGGPVFANLAEAKGLNTSNKTGWLVGLAMGGNRGGVLGVEADVLYGQKGAKVDNGDFDQHIVDVPVMLKINIGSSSVNGLSVFASGGTFFDWQFDRKLNDVDVAGDTSGFEMGWVAGGGVEFLRFSVQGRFIRGLTQISKNFDVATAKDVKTQAFLVLFAFRLN
jgi:Outer membrane protein beta-barrel domain